MQDKHKVGTGQWYALAGALLQNFEVRFFSFPPEDSLNKPPVIHDTARITTPRSALLALDVVLRV